MKMVINHLLSAKDKEAISQVEENPNEIRVFDLTDIVSLGRVLDEYDTHFFECLAYLISEKRIEIKVIKPKNGKGIAQYKSGVSVMVKMQLVIKLPAISLIMVFQKI